MNAALHTAIAHHAAHAAMGCDDPLTDSLVDQCTQPAPLDFAEGQHPIQLQADADLRLPIWWPFAAAAVLVLTIAASAAYPWGFAT